MKISWTEPPPGGRQGPTEPWPVGTPWRAQGVRTSIALGYGTVERSVEPRWVALCQITVPTEIHWNPI